MKLFIIIFLLIFKTSVVYASNDLIFFLEGAYKNNPVLNAERKNKKAIKENINISYSEFLPSVSISGSIDSNELSGRTNQAGTKLVDTNQNTETKKISVDQKIFQGFEGYNTLQKSELEYQRANLKLKNMEQETLFKTTSAYYNLIYAKNRMKFNLENLDLFERQVEFDSARLQKGEITLTDLAQSESSLAGAKANLISAENEFLSSKNNFERITRMNSPETIEEKVDLKINLPNSLKEALKISKKNNPKLLIAKLDFEISKKNLNIEKAQLSPSASINYSKSETSGLSSTVDKADQESVKATVTWPIINGGKNFSSIKKSKFEKEKTNLLLEDTINEVVTDTTNAWSLYRSSGSILEATKSQVTAAEIANEGITLEYDSGNTRTTMEVIQSRSLLLDSKIANAKAKRDFIISKFKILSVLGELTLDSIKNS